MIIANTKTYEKTNENGEKWRCQIIDGLILGMGVISGVFVPENKIHTTLEIGSQYSCMLKNVCKNGKLFCEIDSIDTDLDSPYA